MLADAAGSRIYQVGERLPGGSVLRRVEASHVLLWRNGREERLALRQEAKPLLRKLDPGKAAMPRFVLRNTYARWLGNQSDRIHE